MAAGIVRAPQRLRVLADSFQGLIAPAAMPTLRVAAGHLLLQGMPGLAKTLLVNAIAKAIDLKFARVQFTIDLLPSDIVGSEILDQRTSER